MLYYILDQLYMQFHVPGFGLVRFITFRAAAAAVTALVIAFWIGPKVIRKLKAAGFVEVRSGRGSHLLLKHPTTGKEVWVAVHTKKDAGRLGNRILREAGVE